MSADDVLEFATRLQRLSQLVCGLALMVWVVLKLRELEAAQQHNHQHEVELSRRVWLLEHPDAGEAK